MKKFFKITGIICSLLSICVFSLIIYGDIIVPDSLTVGADCDMTISHIFSVKNDEKIKEVSVFSQDSDVRTGQTKLFDVFPVKRNSLKVTDNSYVIPGGEIIGIRMYTDGVIVVSADSIETADGIVSPGKGAGIRSGDIIKKVNGIKCDSVSVLNSQIAQNNGKAVSLTVLRNGETFETSITSVYCITDSKYRCGLWVRDSTAGLGTLTYIDPENKTYGALGHAICDTDTGILFPAGQGNILTAVFNGCVKGQSGKTGEIQGSFGREILGDLTLNCDNGIFGSYSALTDGHKTVKVAKMDEIEEGDAQIIATVDSGEKKYYNVKIERISYDVSDGSHNFTIKVTDEKLIETTGGIVQGMSGSPIIQNGMLIGAVTHVFLNDPQYGYGIFAQTMIDTDRGVNLKDAA